MSIGIVTGFTHNDSEYDVPTSKTQRKRFAKELARKLEALDGVERVTVADASRSWDGVDLEIELETETPPTGRTRVVPNLRSLSPRIRNTLDEFTPASSFNIWHTPTPIDAENGVYENALYIAEARLY